MRGCDAGAGPAAVRTAVLDTVADVPAAEWDRLAATAPLYQTHSWLRWAAAYHDLPNWYVVARDGEGRLRGAVVAYLMRRPPDGLTRWYDPVRMFLAPHCDTGGAARRWFPVLLLGGCSGYRGAILHAPDLGGAARVAVTRALLDRCRALAGEHGCGSVA